MAGPKTRKVNRVKQKSVPSVFFLVNKVSPFEVTEKEWRELKKCGTQWEKKKERTCVPSSSWLSFSCQYRSGCHQNQKWKRNFSFSRTLCVEKEKLMGELRPYFLPLYFFNNFCYSVRLILSCVKHICWNAITWIAQLLSGIM